MVGFSLKKKEEPKKSGFSGFQLKKNGTPLQKKSNKPFGFAKEEDDEVKEQKIDTFDSNEGGAFNKKEGPKKKDEPLVIKNEGNQNWRSKAQQRFNPASEPTAQDAKTKLEYGMNYSEKTEDNSIEKSKSPLLSNDQETLSFKQDVESRPDMASMDDYERIPVESFGAAMLRGMGWKGDDESDDGKEKKKPVIPVAQRTLYLGLGAKDLNKDGGLKPIDKSYVPVKMVDRRTGEVVREESRTNSRSRDRSPNRFNGTGSYRSRN